MERFKLWDVTPLTDESVSPKQEPELLYFPCEGAKNCVIVFPGGGYITLCDSYEGVELAEWLNTIGVAAFVLRYRVLPYHYPCQLADAHRAIRFVRHNAERFGIDKDKIGAMGFSAGGNTRTHAARKRKRPDRRGEFKTQCADSVLLRFDIFGRYTHSDNGKLSRRPRNGTG